MNLQPVNPPMRTGQTVQCCACHCLTAFPLADMDGEPFAAYYCPDCAAAPAPTLYAEALAAGLVTGHHESDLYLRNTGESRALLLKHGRRATGFRDAVSGEPALDVPFAYQPFWDAVAKRATA